MRNTTIYVYRKELGSRYDVKEDRKTGLNYYTPESFYHMNGMKTDTILGYANLSLKRRKSRPGRFLKLENESLFSVTHKPKKLGVKLIGFVPVRDESAGDTTGYVGLKKINYAFVLPIVIYASISIYSWVKLLNMCREWLSLL